MDTYGHMKPHIDTDLDTYGHIKKHIDIYRDTWTHRDTLRHT